MQINKKAQFELRKFEERFKYYQSHITLRPGMDALLDMLQDGNILFDNSSENPVGLVLEKIQILFKNK